MEIFRFRKILDKYMSRVLGGRNVVQSSWQKMKNTTPPFGSALLGKEPNKSNITPPHIGPCV